MQDNQASRVLGKGIRFWREQRGLSVLELARKLDVSSDRLTAIEAGNDEVHLDDLQRFADALSVKIYDLFTSDACRSDKPVENAATQSGNVA